MLKFLNNLPSKFFEIDQENVLEVFDSPTIIRLKGKIDTRPVFVSTLLHGNETSSFVILQEYLKKYENTELPRSIIIFVGNPQAYHKNVRHLKDQLDYNRIWQQGHSYEHLVAKEVYEYLKAQNLYASLDFHNNTGKNPHYACINKRNIEFIRLAQNFSQKIVYFTEPESVLSLKMANLCPSLTLECGLSGSYQGIINGIQLLETTMDSKSAWEKKDIKIKYVYQSFGTILVHPNVALNFDHDERFDGISLIKDFDEYNFSEISIGTSLGFIQDKRTIKVVNNSGVNITDHFLNLENNEVKVANPFTASMFTKNTSVAKSDCLGYLMKKLPLDSFLN